MAVIHSIHAVGYFDVACGRNLLVAASPNFASLVFEELNEHRKLIPLDILTPTYEGGVNCCSFNDFCALRTRSLGAIQGRGRNAGGTTPRHP